MKLCERFYVASRNCATDDDPSWNAIEEASIWARGNVEKFNGSGSDGKVVKQKVVAETTLSCADNVLKIVLNWEEQWLQDIRR